MKATQNGLMRHTIKGGHWVLLARSMGWGRTFVRTVVLARLLAPHDFGLFGIALLLLSLLEAFSRTGLWEALIQKDGDITPYLDTVWTLGLIRGVLIALLLFSSANAVALFFNAPEAEAMIRIIGCAMVFQGLSNIGTVYFDKTLDYSKYFQLSAAGALADLGVTLMSVFYFNNAWALVAGCLAGELAACLMSYILHPYRPGPALDIRKARELLSFGRWIWGSGVLTYLTSKADDLFVGKILGVMSLGFYQMAFRFSGLISTEIIFPLLKVTFPAYAVIRDDIPRLNQAYIKVLTVISALSLFLAVLLFVLADAVVCILLGDSWLPVVPILRILVFSGCLRAWQRSLVQMAKALGHPRIQTQGLMIQLAVFAILIYPATHYMGTAGAALVVLIQGMVSLPWILRQVIFRTGLSYREVLQPVIRQGGAALVTGVVLFYAQKLFQVGIVSLCVEVCLAVTVYAGISMLISREIFVYMKLFNPVKVFSHVR